MRVLGARGGGVSSVLVRDPPPPPLPALWAHLVAKGQQLLAIHDSWGSRFLVPTTQRGTIRCGVRTVRTRCVYWGLLRGPFQLISRLRDVGARAFAQHCT